MRRTKPQPHMERLSNGDYYTVNPNGTITFVVEDDSPSDEDCSYFYKEITLTIPDLIQLTIDAQTAKKETEDAGWLINTYGQLNTKSSITSRSLREGEKRTQPIATTASSGGSSLQSALPTNTRRSKPVASTTCTGCGHDQADHADGSSHCGAMLNMFEWCNCHRFTHKPESVEECIDHVVHLGFKFRLFGPIPIDQSYECILTDPYLYVRESGTSPLQAFLRAIEEVERDERNATKDKNPDQS